jgi:hypothetical protein
MRFLLMLAVLVAALTTTVYADVSGMNATISKFKAGRLNFIDTGTGLAPVYFYDDFVGYKLNKYVANENTTALWATVETQLNAGLVLTADAHSVTMVLDTDDNASRAVLYFGDQECFDGYVGCTMEARVRNSVATTDVAEILVGLAGADNATADSVDVNAWFRVLAAAPTTLLWESDDDSTNDDDNDTGITLSTSSWYVLRVEVTGGTSGYARFFVDGVQVGEGVMTGLTTTTGMLQPYIAVQKASGTGVGTLLVDYVRVWGNRK